jgi:hypothetical protein
MSEKRNLFEELTQGISEIRLHDTGKLTLRTLERALPDKPVPQLTPEVITGAGTLECFTSGFCAESRLAKRNRFSRKAAGYGAKRYV